MEDKEIYDYHVRLVLYKNDSNKTKGVAASFGPGMAQILHYIQDGMSLNQAANEMNMAYSNIWKHVNNTEANLGVKLIERDKNKGSKITEEGLKILALYEKVQKAANEAIEKVLEEEGTIL